MTWPKCTKAEFCDDCWTWHAWGSRPRAGAWHRILRDLLRRHARVNCTWYRSGPRLRLSIEVERTLRWWKANPDS
jgi:hypothetical protein